MDIEEAIRVLKLNKNYSKGDIKMSYKRLAMVHHPDRDGSNGEVFKKIGVAKEVLMSDGKGKVVVEKAVIVEGNPNAIKPHFNIEIEKSDKGREICLKIPIVSFCKNCNHGMVTNSSIGKCTKCNGTGKKNNIECGDCNGIGKEVKNPCSKCNGTGYCKFLQTKYVTIGKSHKDGESISVDGIKSINRTTATITVRFKGRYSWKNNSDVEMRIGLYTAIFGGQVVATIMGKKLRISIPRNIQPNQVMKINTGGVNINIKIIVRLPTDLSVAEKKAIKVALNRTKDNEEMGSN